MLKTMEKTVLLGNVRVLSYIELKLRYFWLEPIHFWWRHSLQKLFFTYFCLEIAEKYRLHPFGLSILKVKIAISAIWREQLVFHITIYRRGVGKFSPYLCIDWPPGALFSWRTRAPYWNEKDKLFSIV